MLNPIVPPSRSSRARFIVSNPILPQGYKFPVSHAIDCPVHSIRADHIDLLFFCSATQTVYGHLYSEGYVPNIPKMSLKMCDIYLLLTLEYVCRTRGIWYNINTGHVRQTKVKSCYM